MHILVVTGASGVGKTAAVNALNTRRIAGVQCFHFDEIGVPSPAVMERDYGGDEQWQAPGSWVGWRCRQEVRHWIR